MIEWLMKQYSCKLNTNTDRFKIKLTTTFVLEESISNNI